MAKCCSSTGHSLLFYFSFKLCLIFIFWWTMELETVHIFFFAECLISNSVFVCLFVCFLSFFPWLILFSRRHWKKKTMDMLWQYHRCLTLVQAVSSYCLWPPLLPHFCPRYELVLALTVVILPTIPSTSIDSPAPSSLVRRGSQNQDNKIFRVFLAIRYLEFFWTK
jgi:hypothetical protein